MSEAAVLEKIESLKKTVRQLESRVEELEAHEDLRDLEKAVRENEGKPLVAWEQAKALLDLD